MKWEEYTLNQICSVICGAVIKRNEFSDSGIPVIKTANIKSKKLILKKLSYVPVSVAEKRKKNWIQQGDVLFTMTGSGMGGNPDNQVGQTAVFNERGRYILNQRICIIRPKDNMIDSEYLAYYLASEQSRLQFVNLKRKAGKQLNVLLSDLKVFKIKVPDLTVQKRIVAVQKEIEEKIEECNREIEGMEKQIQTCFENLYLNNKKAEWKEGTLEDIGTITAGGTPSKNKAEYYTNHGIAWITARDLSYKKIKFISHGKKDITELGLRKSSASLLPAGTVLFSSRAPIGCIAIALNELTTNQGFRSVIPKENIGTAFTYYLLKHLLPAIKEMGIGLTFKEVSGSMMKKIPVTIPDDVTLRTFEDFCQPIFEKQRALEMEKQRLEILEESMWTNYWSEE